MAATVKKINPTPAETSAICQGFWTLWFPLVLWDGGSIWCEDCPLMFSVWWPGFFTAFRRGCQCTPTSHLQGIMSSFDRAVQSSSVVSNMCFFRTQPISASACLANPGGKPVQSPAAFICKPAVLSCVKGLPCRSCKEQLAQWHSNWIPPPLTQVAVLLLYIRRGRSERKKLFEI